MLQLARLETTLYPMTQLETVIDAIQARAIARWGEKKWRAELARATVEIIQRNDPTATYESRRRQIYRVFEEKACMADTLLALVEAVGCRLQMTCTEIKETVIDL